MAIQKRCICCLVNYVGSQKLCLSFIAFKTLLKSHSASCILVNISDQWMTTMKLYDWRSFHLFETFVNLGKYSSYLQPHDCQQMWYLILIIVIVLKDYWRSSVHIRAISGGVGTVKNYVWYNIVPLPQPLCG